MPTEIIVLALGCVLLLVHVLAAIHVKTKQYGRDWNIGARDEALPPPSALAGRLERAQANFLETFPIAIVALLGVVLMAKTNGITELAAWVWLLARAIYLPLYWTGVKGWRTTAWSIATLAILVVLLVLLV